MPLLIPIQGAEGGGDVPEEVTLDKWFQPAAQPVSPKPPLFQGTVILEPIEQSAGYVEELTLDKWFREIVQPIFRTPQAQQGLQIFAEDLPNASFDWFMPTSQTFVRKLRAQPSMQIFFVPPSTVITDGIVIIIDLVNQNLR